MFDITALPIFFLGANTVSGYVSRFADCYDSSRGWRVFAIKGGPGTGKSSLMKRIAAKVAERGERVELVSCTADPNSLDAVLCPDSRLAVLDGTAPHLHDPDYPGISGRIINLGRFWSEEKLVADRCKIMALFKENAALHKRAAGYVAASAGILSDSRRIAERATDFEKLDGFAKKLAVKNIPQGEGKGNEQIRFLSGITPAGVTFYRSTVEKLCDRVVEVYDENGAVAPRIMDAVRRRALDCGYDIITCRSPLYPLERNEHILIPQLSLGFCTVNRYLASTGHNRRIHAKRFEDAEAMRSHKQRLAFNRRAVGELISGATEILSEAKRVHDLLEQYYIGAMDFESLEQYISQLLEEV